MARIRKRGKKWTAEVSWYINNERQYKSKGGFETKRDAQKWANEMEVAKDEDSISNQDPIFAEYYKSWYEAYRIAGKSKNTINRYKHLYKILKSYFGNSKISSINRLKYQEFMNYYGEKHAKDSVKKIHGYIRTCAKDAISDGIIRKNFTDRINLIWNHERTRKIDYLNFEQTQKLVASLLDGIKPSYVSRYMLLTIIYTGMRPGEIRVLTWNDIDFKNKQIHITKSWDYDNDKIVNYDSNEINKSTKNYSSTRVIAVDKKLLDILLKLKQNKNEHLFIGSDGTIPTSNAVNKVLRKQLKKLDIEKKGFHFHSLRHTHVALLLFKGVDLYSISKRLGHSNMSTTASHYAYMLDELKQKSDDKIVNILDKI